MAEAFARLHGIDASSAGIEPAAGINPTVAAAMKERGIGMAGAPRMLTMAMIERADIVITMGCSVEKVCPAPMARRMGKKLADWDLDDPKGRDIAGVRRIRDEIERRVLELAAKG